MIRHIEYKTHVQFNCILDFFIKIIGSKWLSDI